MASRTPITASSVVHRRFPVGAELQPLDLVSIRVWARDHAHVSVVVDEIESSLTREDDGYFAGLVRGSVGSRYGFLLEGQPALLPDPASRWQPDGPHGLSAIVDPGAYAWRDEQWRGLATTGQIIYQLHVGTFTADGTWAAAAEYLPRLRDLGVTTIQMMPVADFPGRFGWGYDGVCWFAPTRLYGTPDDLRAFVDQAHRLGLGVILDVVYNHLGPDGNHLRAFSTAYFTDRYENEWGEALNFDGPGSSGLRELVLSNAEYWVREFHVDGFRFDATQQIFDRSPEHILAATTRRARAAAGARGLLLIGENEPQDATLMRPVEDGGGGLDLLYNDDLHHTARVLLTGVREAYYTDYRGTPQELLSAARWGFLFQGQHYSWQKKARGEPALDLPPSKFLAFLENHDQVANSATGQRLATLAAPGLLRALTAYLLLTPATPLILQGQEIGSDRPFRFFADHAGELGDAVRDGRRQFLSQFSRYARPEVAELVAPSALETFRACVLDHTDPPRSRQWFALHRDLLAIRRTDVVLNAPHAGEREPSGAFRPEGALLGERAFLLRWITANGDDRLLLINLGCDLDVAAQPEPLLAPPRDRRWSIAWSSEAIEYGGAGTPPYEPAHAVVPGQAALWLIAVPRSADEPREEHAR
jgi:maltooligosyltrehalose trehalohydrolase